MLVEATLDFPEEEIDFLQQRRRAGPAAARRRPASTRVLLRGAPGRAAARRHPRRARRPAERRQELAAQRAGRRRAGDRHADRRAPRATRSRRRSRSRACRSTWSTPPGLRDARRRGRADRRRAHLGRDRARRCGRLPARPDARSATPATRPATPRSRRGCRPAGRRRAACSHVFNKRRPAATPRPCDRWRWSSRRSPARASTRCARALLELAGWQAAPEGLFIARARHVHALQRARQHLGARGGARRARRRRPRAVRRRAAAGARRARRDHRRVHRPTICSAPSSGASASASDPAPRGQKRRAGRATRQMDGRAAPVVAGRNRAADNRGKASSPAASEQRRPAEQGNGTSTNWSRRCRRSTQTMRSAPG